MNITLDINSAVVLALLIICLTLITLIALARPRKEPSDRTKPTTHSGNGPFS
jgi:hypothetical protein